MHRCLVSTINILVTKYQLDGDIAYIFSCDRQYALFSHHFKHISGLRQKFGTTLPILTCNVHAYALKSRVYHSDLPNENLQCA